MLNFGASKPRVKGGGPGPPPLDPHLAVSESERNICIYLGLKVLTSGTPLSRLRNSRSTTKTTVSVTVVT